MLKSHYPLLGVLVLTTAATLASQDQDERLDPLDPLRFLEGTWHGEGKGPYGGYEFETRVVRRGRWLLAYQ